MSLEFQACCEASGIKRHMTAPYSPQQNGVVERRNRTLLEMTRSILKHMGVPNNLWGEDVRHATYLINRVATRSLDGRTPYEALRGVKPNLKHLKVFGCISHARTESAGRRKLDDRSKALVHLGTEPGSKAYRLFDTISKRIIVSRDVVFEENKGWNWSELKDGDNDGELTIEIKRLREEEDTSPRITEEGNETIEEDDVDIVVKMTITMKLTFNPEGQQE